MFSNSNNLLEDKTICMRVNVVFNKFSNADQNRHSNVQPLCNSILNCNAFPSENNLNKIRYMLLYLLFTLFLVFGCIAIFLNDATNI